MRERVLGLVELLHYTRRERREGTLRIQQRERIEEKKRERKNIEEELREN